MDGYRKKLRIDENTTLDNYSFFDEIKPQAMRCLYDLLFTLRHFLEIQQGLKGLKTSEMMKGSLQALLYFFCDQEVSFKKVSVGAKDNTEAKQAYIDDILRIINMKLERLCYLLKISPEDKLIEGQIAELMKLPAEKEQERGSRSSKREKAYEVIERYLLADTPIKVIKLFKAIQEGIELSRQYGSDKAKSAQLELKIRPFRDAVIRLLFIDNVRELDFKAGHYKDILGYISYPKETCRYAMRMIDWSNAEESDSLQKVDLQKLGHFTSLFYSIPNEINGEKLKKATYVLSMGMDWSRALEGLVVRWGQDNVHGETINTIACLWNFYIYSCFKNDGLDFEKIFKYEKELCLNIQTIQKQDLLVPPEKIQHDLINSETKRNKKKFLEFSGQFNHYWVETDVSDQSFPV